MYCKSCGSPLTPGASFCENCGTAVEPNKYCVNCGGEMPADAQICPACGYNQNSFVRSGPPQNSYTYQNREPVSSDREYTLKTIVKIFMVLGCIGFGWLIIPLFWCIPLTVSVFNKFKTGEEITVGTKICVLLFVNMIAGICLLCMDD